MKVIKVFGDGAVVQDTESPHQVEISGGLVKELEFSENNVETYIKDVKNVKANIQKLKNKEKKNKNN